MTGKELAVKVFELSADEFEEFLGNMVIGYGELTDDQPDLVNMQLLFTLAYNFWYSREGN